MLQLQLFFNKYRVIEDCNHLFFKLYNKENDDKENIYNKKIFQKCVLSFREEIKFKNLNNEIKKKGKNFNEKKKKDNIQEKKKFLLT